MDSELYEKACGFLLSYSWLIRYISDYLIATKGDQNPCLVLSAVRNQWQSFIEELLDHPDLAPSVSHDSTVRHRNFRNHSKSTVISDPIPNPYIVPYS